LKQKIIYIAGLGHSGSTILDLALGANSDIIGLGEVYTLLDKDRRNKHLPSKCSCGEKGKDCPFWKKTPKILDGLNDKDSIEKKYDILISHFQNTFGNEKILVDSSKNSYSYLKYLNETYDLKVVFLTRDIRSWIYSRFLNTRKPILYLAFRWYMENRKLHYQLRKMKITFKQVGYEELALYPEQLMPLISEFSEIKYDPNMLHPDNSNSHIISGNIARVDQKKRNKFTYDARWLLSSRLSFVTPLLLVFMKWNRTSVYSNVSKKGLKDFYLFGTARRENLSQKFN